MKWIVGSVEARKCGVRVGVRVRVEVRGGVRGRVGVRVRGRGDPQAC